MRLRTLGASGLKTPPLVFGGNILGWTADRKTGFDLLDTFVAGGGTMIDTADFYMAMLPGNKGGESEAEIGAWLRQRKRRDDVVIVTKVGRLAGKGGEGLAPARIAAAVDESLGRLQTDYIDVYLGHRDDLNTPIEDQLLAFDKLVRAGKVRSIGVSNYTPERIAQGLQISDDNGLVRYSVMEPLYNLVERDTFEGQYLEIARKENFGVIPYFGLASGFLTGKYRSQADLKGGDRDTFVSKYINERGRAILEVLDEVADEITARPAQIALAWLMAQESVTAPIASATTLPQMEQLLQAMQIVLSPDHLSRLDQVSRGAVFG